MTLDRFFADESGAVTIDWVVLAAGLMILSAGLAGLFSDEVQATMDNMELTIEKFDDFTPPVEN
ncbi:MAG: hypothetical protein AAFS07_15380 [Pseudomonadota bacterium]